MSGCQGNLLEKGTLEMERVKVGQVGRATCRVSPQLWVPGPENLASTLVCSLLMLVTYVAPPLAHTASTSVLLTLEPSVLYIAVTESGSLSAFQRLVCAELWEPCSSAWLSRVCEVRVRCRAGPSVTAPVAAGLL